MESIQHGEPWNKGKLVGQKPPLKAKDIWAIRITSIEVCAAIDRRTSPRYATGGKKHVFRESNAPVKHHVNYADEKLAKTVITSAETVMIVLLEAHHADQKAIR